jgi:hypothetical protein
LTEVKPGFYTKLKHGPLVRQHKRQQRKENETEMLGIPAYKLSNKRKLRSWQSAPRDQAKTPIN